jgi:putative Mg2+ transporter-C (MgtC) family protein
MQPFLEILRSIEGRFLSETIARLVLAAVLGGIIGLERELKHRPAGLRTNMFICFGAAMFTIMSFKLASVYPGDHTRIAAQIIPGIGFIGAGAILHARGAVTGLTTAATIFVVASIGMAAGGGQYLSAIFATVLILICLSLLLVLEKRFGLKSLVMTYEAIGPNGEAIIAAANQILEDERKDMQSVHVSRSDHQYRILFKVEATRHEHDALIERLRQNPAFTHIASLGESDKE